MMRKFFGFVLVAVLLFSTVQCNRNQVIGTIKLMPDDPFARSIITSEEFIIQGKQDAIVEGEKGTVLVFPKGCFMDAGGKIVEDDIQVELAEAFSLEDMLLSNLTTTSDGKLLETGGMIYFNARSNGVQLFINKDNPVHIEMPVSQKKPGMMAYKGSRDEKGNMNWVSPKELDNYLKTVDINSLDFLPGGFESEVEKGLPYKNHKVVTQELADSLYYQFSVGEKNDLLKGLSPTTYNEPYYNRSKKVVKGKYTQGSFLSGEKNSKPDSLAIKADCGIDPAIIKVIRSEKYQNTLIATKEFEARLKVIFKTCKTEILEIYLNNLDKNLFELDSMSAVALGENSYFNNFISFSRQRLTKVKGSDKMISMLREYFKKSLDKVKSELAGNREKLLDDLNQKNESFRKTADGYKALLWKREKYRMQTYGFNWTETGWINIDKGSAEKDWNSIPLQIVASNGKAMDRIYTYVFYTSIKSLYRLNSNDHELFYPGNEQTREMLMPKNKTAVAVAIGYQGEDPWLAVKEFETGAEQKVTITLEPSTPGKVRDAIKYYERFGEENKISKDAEFMIKIYQEEQRQKMLRKETDFMSRLHDIAFPCCQFFDSQKDTTSADAFTTDLF